MKKSVIFDLDGTLLDTIADLGTACNHALRKNGLHTHELSAYNAMVGNGIRNLIRRAAPGQPETKTNKILRDFLEYYDAHCTDLTHPYTGIPELLSTLKNEGVMLAVCSNKYQKAADRIITRFFPDTFNAVYGERDGIPRKPAPDVLFRIMETLGADPRRTVLVGDSEVDVDAARNAGIPSIAVTWGFRSEEQLKEAAPTYMVHTPRELAGLLGSTA